MKKYLLPFVTISILAISCSKKSNAPSNSANVMFVNGCLPSSVAFTIDAKVNNTAVSGATGIALLKNSGYRYVTVGSNESVAFFVTGLNSLVSSTATLTANSNYSVFAGGSIQSAAIIIQPDDLSAPAAGYAKVRFVNLSIDTLNENCYIGGGSTPIVSNVGMNTITAFYPVAAATANVLMQDPAKPTKIPSNPLNGQVFAAGKIYTIMITGTSNISSGSSSLNLNVINNN